MAEHIIGDWKNYTFHMATMADHERIAKHICENYLLGEPMQVALGLPWCDINAAEHTQLVGLCLSHGISYYVAKKGSNEIVAVNLLMDSTKEGFGFVGLPPSQSPRLSKIERFIHKFHVATLDKHHSQAKYNRYVDIFITSVDAKFRGQGIADEMYRRMMIYLKAIGVQAVQSAFTSFGTRAICHKLNFLELGREYFTDAVDDYGNKVFLNAKEGEFVAEMIKTT